MILSKCIYTPNNNTLYPLSKVRVHIKISEIETEPYFFSSLIKWPTFSNKYGPKLRSDFERTDDELSFFLPYI